MTTNFWLVILGLKEFNKLGCDLDQLGCLGGQGVLKSVKKAFVVFDLLASNPEGLGVTEIAKQIGISKSTASRILSTFQAQELVLKVAGRRYQLGPKILQWASTFIANADIGIVALPYLWELRKRTGETASVFVRRGDRRVCIQRVQSFHGIRHVLEIGEQLPLHAGAAGKVLLAYMPEEERRDFLRRATLGEFTPRTITSVSELEKELAKIREEGAAVSYEERVPLAASVAAPVRDYKGDVVAAVCISGPMSRLRGNKLQHYIPLLKDVAAQISRRLGFSSHGLDVEAWQMKGDKIPVAGGERKLR